MRKAISHLKKSDPVLGALIERVGPFRMAYREPLFSSVVRAIVYQQLSGKAAATIYGRLVALCAEVLGVEVSGRPGEDEAVVTPEAIQQLSVGQMKRAGLSQQKTSYIRDLAEHAAEGRLDFSRLHELPDEEVVAALTAVKGVGQWTAQMFLMFALRRENVLPCGDLGVQNAIKRAYGKRKVTPKQVEKMRKMWHPYCSVASWYLWRSLELTEPKGTPSRVAKKK